MLKGIVNGVEKDIIRIPMIGDAPATVTGTNSVTFETDATSVIGYEIEGNMQQTGTPSPDNIIMPDFCGVRTANLIDLDDTEIGLVADTGVVNTGNTNYLTTNLRVFKAGTYTISLYNPYAQTSYNTSTRVCTYTNGVFDECVLNDNARDADYSASFTLAQDKQVRISVRKTDENVMLNTGSTALPYESFGWKIPITCAGQTVPVYLGQTQTVRKIRKLVLNGTENWQAAAASGGRNRFTIVTNSAITADTANPFSICSHIPLGASGATYTTDDVYTIASERLYVRLTSQYNKLDGFKTYLAQQYAAGTPVTVWYVLAEPETGIINEPLCKIGEYTDELHSEDAGVMIPTAKGQNTLSIETTLSPSSTEVTYLGIKNAYKEGWEVRDNQDRLIWGYNSTISGVPPLTFKGGGTPLISLSMLGNTQQTGTPAPDNIIMPDFCGVRTENLFDISTVTLGKYINAQGVETASTAQTPVQALNHTDYITIQPNTDYTYHYKFRYGVANTIALCWFDASKNLISRDTKNITSQDNEYTLTGASPANAAFCIINFAGYLPNEGVKLSFNLGSTALPYEPYGYKIPITCAGQTVPVYLGQTQTVRKIKKLVLTGEENITFASEDANRVVGSFIISGMGMNSSEIGYCNILQWKNSYSQNEYNRIVADRSTRFYLSIAKSALPESTFDGFIAYLQRQYQNNNPVIIWYVLAEPKTGIINEPLCKIGEYADELHSEDAAVSIPTAKGQNTLTVDTELQPSDVSITGHIKSTS